MKLPAIWLGKLTGAALRRIGRRGNALPGLVVERVFPGFLPAALADLPMGVVVVSGTNGKTTTTKMVATILAQRYRVLTNDTGSNFVRGAITAVCDYADWRGRIDADVAVFELDEAHAVRFVEVVKPERVLLLNVMRDQMDRFGEIDTTAHLLRTVAAAASTAVVLNRDDARLVALAASMSAPVTFFGVAPSLRADFPTDDELYGVDETRAAPPLVEASAVLQSMDLGETSRLSLQIGAETHDVALRAGGAHNAQNAAGAAAMALTFPLTPTTIATGLRAVEPAFGRGQTFTVDGRRLVLHLVKNPAGFRQTLRTVGAYEPAAVVIAINDDYADSRDVSWLWDVDFSGPLGAVPDSSRGSAPGDSRGSAPGDSRGSVPDSSVPDRPWLLTAGTRAADMALRLRYDEIDTDAIETDLRAAVVRAVQQIEPGQTVIVLSTYTAMWALHAILLDIGTPVALADGELSDGPAPGGPAVGSIDPAPVEVKATPVDVKATRVEVEATPVEVEP